MGDIGVNPSVPSGFVMIEVDPAMAVSAPGGAGGMGRDSPPVGVVSPVVGGISKPEMAAEAAAPPALPPARGDKSARGNGDAVTERKRARSATHVEV